MEVDVPYNLKKIDGVWHVRIGDYPLNPGWHDKHLAKVYMKGLQEKGLQSIIDWVGHILDEEFKEKK